MWDKNKPAGNQKIRLSDEEIRANWAALEDALSREHIFPGTEGEDAGEHKALTLRQQNSAPGTASGKVGLYAKDDGHLYYVDPDGNEFKIWHEGNDGENSGLDADTVRGVVPSTLAKKDLSNVDDDTFLDKIKEVDGEDSGVDADLIRGLPGDFTCSKNTNGYTKLPNGLIIQWGYNSVGGQSSKAISFPISFSNACLAVVSVPVGSTSGGGSEDYWGVYNISKSGFTQSNQYDGSHNFYWIAIGH